MEVKKYSQEFKEETLVIAEGDGVGAACEKLGLKKHNIYDWRRERRLAGKEIIKGQLAGETAEQTIKGQEKELKELREANEILKKAMGFIMGR
jgi:transposase